MAHRSSKLTPAGRHLVVRRYQAGWVADRVAEAVGVSRATVYKWVRRFATEGAAGMQDRSSRPRRSPRALSREQVERILRLRRGLKQGPHRLVPLAQSPRSTIYAVLRRHGCSRLRDFDRVSGSPLRYVRERPGELLHMDVKKLGRVPSGGGHRVLGRAGLNRHRSVGYDFIHVAVDDTSRVAYVAALPDETASSTIHFIRSAVGFFADLGVQVERLMTDGNRTYRVSRDLRLALDELGIKHKFTRPYRPQTNGKAERFIQTLLNEWAYTRPYRSNEERLRALPRWVAFYNSRRTHTALGNQAPLPVLVNNLLGNYS